MSSLWDKLSGMLGWIPVEDNYEDYDEYEEPAETYGNSAGEDVERSWSKRSEPSSAARGTAPHSEPRVVKLAGGGAGERTMRVAIAEPQGFGDVQEVAEQLKKRIGVVVNVEALDREVARRVIDFLSGTVYALDGEMQKVSAGVVMFVPRDMRIDRMVENVERAGSKSPSNEEGLRS